MYSDFEQLFKIILAECYFREKFTLCRLIYIPMALPHTSV